MRVFGHRARRKNSAAPAEPREAVEDGRPADHAAFRDVFAAHQVPEPPHSRSLGGGHRDGDAAVLPDDGTEDQDTYGAGQSDEPFAARRRLASRERSEPPRRRIWDIDDDASRVAYGPELSDEDCSEAESRAAPSSVGDPAEPRSDERRGAQGVETGDPLRHGEGIDTADNLARLEADVARARAQVAAMSAAGSASTHAREVDASGSGGPAGRAKTRLLGFQSREIAGFDPFARGDSAGANGLSRAGPHFPVGWLIVLAGPGRGASFTLTDGVATLGRGADQTVQLDLGDTSISRQAHASIAYDEGANRFYLGHGGKTNIVRLNGRPVLSTEDLNDGDTIQIGETTLRFVALCGDSFTWDEAADERPDHPSEGHDAGRM